MAKDKVAPGTDTQATSNTGEENMATKPTGPATGPGPAQAPGQPTTAQERSTATDGRGAGAVVDDPRDAARKPRKNQPAELAQLVQSEETRRRIAQSLPKHMTPERWISVLLTVNSGDSLLQKCDPRTIVRAALQGAVLGLDFNKTLREAYLIPRGHTRAGPDGNVLRDERGHIITFYEATFMPGYAGLRKLVMNGGDVLNIRSALVYESELTGKNGSFVYQFTPDLQFLHQPCLNPRDRGALVLAYSVAKLKSGEYSIEVMSIDEVEKSAHQRSEMWKASRGVGKVETGPWVNDYDQMVRKSVLKRHCNQLPMSPEAAEAINLDNQHYVSSVDPTGQATGRLAIEHARRDRGAATLAERLDDLDDDSIDINEPIDGETSVIDTGHGEPT